MKEAIAVNIAFVLISMLMIAAAAGAIIFLIFFVLRKISPPLPPLPPFKSCGEKTSPKCPKCGAPLPADSPEGLCPRCLVAMNLATQTEISDETQTAKSPPAPPLPVNEVAKLFPQLEILECLGRGGMGAVYKARQPRLDRIVALKILSPEKQNEPKFAGRFEREARALAKLHHPNIVTVYDFGETQGNFYLLMEFVDGLTLRQLLQARKLSPAEALGIVPKICEALQYAHEQGIIHRDIKPENILLDKNGRVKIADFGIAKILGDGDGRANLTEDQTIGTPHYMSPEQIEKPQTVDHRADIYSLGVVFYEMLTGELPLGKFAAPSAKVQIDVRLDEIVLRALEKEPARRYQQASQVKTDVETISTESTGQLPTHKPDKNMKTKSLVATAAAVFFLIVVAGIFLFWKLFANPPGLVLSVRADGNDRGSVLHDVAFDEGVHGRAFRFNGKDSYVKIPQTPALNPKGQLTLEFWMKADPDNEMQNYQGLVTSDFFFVEISNGYGGTMGVNFGISTTSNPQGDQNGQTTVVSFTHIADANGGGAPVSANEWHHVAGTYDGKELRLYIDGQPWGNPMRHKGTIRPMLPDSFVSIGSEDGRITCPDCIGSRYFKGLIDDVQIYKRALTAAEIKKTYDKGEASR